MYGNNFNPDEIRKNLKKVGFKEQGLDQLVQEAINTRQQEVTIPPIKAPVEMPKNTGRALPKIPQANVLAQANPMPIFAAPEIKPKIQVEEDFQPMVKDQTPSRGGKRAPKAPDQYKTFDKQAEMPTMNVFTPMKEKVVPIQAPEQLANKENAPLRANAVAGSHNPEELAALMRKIAARNIV